MKNNRYFGIGQGFVLKLKKLAIRDIGSIFVQKYNGHIPFKNIFLVYKFFGTNLGRPKYVGLRN